jgi:thioredoxin
MLHITNENFEKEVAKSKLPVIVDFFADWCMPCTMMAPIFEKLSTKLGSRLKFAKVDTQEQGELSQEHHITGIPCLVLFKNGKEAGRIVGYMQEEELEAKLKSYL